MNLRTYAIIAVVDLAALGIVAVSAARAEVRDDDGRAFTNHHDRRRLSRIRSDAG